MKRLILTALLFSCILCRPIAQPLNHDPINSGAFIKSTNTSDEALIASQKKEGEHYKTKWAKDPFDHQVFIENKGQFDTDIHTPEKILYQAMLGNVKAYFTATGVIYKLEKFVAVDDGKHEDKDADEDNSADKPEISYSSYTWNGSNTNITVSGEEEQANFYSYPISKNSSVAVNIFKKIIYKNAYPGIDIEYSFIKGKAGLKYSLILHAGADVSAVKLKYNGINGLKLKSSGDIIINSNIGEITDHAPTSYFAKSRKPVKSNYILTNNNEESFSAKAVIDSTDDLVIDPWTWDPGFAAAYDAAYDVDYDNTGNVYAYGSYNPFELTKFNAAGIQQWTFMASAINNIVYGDFAIDKVTGTAYIVEGANNTTGAQVLKVNTLGNYVTSFPGATSMYEMWRAEYNTCTHQIVIGGGGKNNPNTQACLLDTDMTTFSPVNPLNAVDGYHDVCLIAIDPSGSNAYMAIAANSQNTNFNNVLISMPMPGLTPANYTVGDKFGFNEIGSVGYVLGAAPPNGMNGMAASPNWLYMYDGDTLKKLNKATGAIIANKQVPTVGAFQCGGLDADACDNAYVGVLTGGKSYIQQYSSALALTASILLKSTKGVYDVVLGANDQIVYTAENGYVESISLTTPPSVTITNTKKPTTCGLCNGSATPTLLLCGAAPATTPTYVWSPGGQTTQTATNLCAGTYTVAINLGCDQLYMDTVTISPSVSPPLVLTPSQTNEKCFGNTNGSATISLSGGMSPYSYQWVPSGGTNATASNLAVGTYTVRVTDAACNKDSAIFTITSPAQLRDSISAETNASCFGTSTGTATVGVVGGTTAYTYSWNSTPTQSTAKASSLPAGSYTVTVTDANGCTVKADTTITQPSQIRDSIVSTTSVTCPGSTNGTATVGVKNGTPAYSYLWNSTPTQNTVIATNLKAGSYTCTVTDANGCQETAIATITSLSSMRDSIVTALTVNELCNGSSTGSLTGGVKGGTPAYTYSWTPSGGTNITASNLAAGSYTLTITDQNTCTVTATGTITQPSKVRDSISTSNNVLCFGGNTGSASVGVKNGTPGYTYSWNTTPIETTATATGLSIGSYNCTVTDANNCLSVVNVIIVQPSQLAIKAAGTFPTTCFGACNGSVTVIPKGGTTPYSYLWNTSPPATTPNVTNLCAGIYSVQITDANGCVIDSTPLTVTSPAGMTITKTGTVSAHCGQADGSGGVSVTGGNPPYSYQWSNAGSGTNATLSNVTPGSYCITVTDANTCTDTACIVIGDVPAPVATITSATNDSCNGGADGTATAGVTGNVGPYTYSWNSVPAQTTQTATGLKAGNYTVTVEDSVGCISTVIATIIEPAIVITTTNTPPVACIGQPTTINITGTTGGTPPYSYLWNTGATTTSITVSPVVTTTYTLNTIDTYKCAGGPVTTVVVTVDQPLALTTISPVAICPGATATLTAKGSGGNGNYVYTWNNGATGSNINVTPTVNTVYTVTLTDSCASFIVVDSVQVLIDPLPVVKFTADTLVGCPKQCFSFTDQSVFGGTIKSWLWTFGNGGNDTAKTEYPTYCYDSSGMFTVNLTVTSDSGCMATLSKPSYITIYSTPVAAFTLSPQTTTTLQPLITFTNTSTDIYGIKTYKWDFDEPPYNSTSPAKDTSYTYHDTGTYCPVLYVTNKHGCKDSVEHCLIINPYYTFYIPNAFSPNGDGKNDVFAPKGNFICSFEMYIFDRWGMQLYYSTNMNQGWDGTINGGSAYVQEDTYIYVIHVVDCIEHNKHSFIGKVTVIK